MGNPLIPDDLEKALKELAIAAQQLQVTGAAVLEFMQATLPVLEETRATLEQLRKILTAISTSGSR